MSEPIIRVENLGKKYRIQHRETGPRYRALRDVLSDGIKTTATLCRGRRPPRRTETEEFWALKDVSFDIQKGEVVGIIGRNGAGKSTLLKILSRITEPSAGRVTLNGRVASLLEVGTGFHPELTGRENIYLNGSVLGMSRAEVRGKFDEIVAFAEVEQFLDTPVKRYSSGMYVRLAFAVAAHLEPEILVVDEVLAVGDAEFQKKSLGKMREVSRGGRTVVFVSHNMQTVLALCDRACLLKGGRIEAVGTTREIVSEYLTGGSQTPASRQWSNLDSAPRNEIVRLLSVRATTQSGANGNFFDIREPIGLEIEYDVLVPGHVLWFGFNVHNSDGVNVFDVHSTTSAWYSKAHPGGRFRSVAWIPGNLLAEGVFSVGAAIFNHLEYKIHLHERDVIAFTVVDQMAGDSARGKTTGIFPGVIRPMLVWETTQIGTSQEG